METVEGLLVLGYRIICKLLTAKYKVGQNDNKLQVLKFRGGHYICSDTFFSWGLLILCKAAVNGKGSCFQVEQIYWFLFFYDNVDVSI